MTDRSKLRIYYGWLGKILCGLGWHPYLIAFKNVLQWNGQKWKEREVEYLLCPRCHATYYYIFHEWWHTDREMKMHDEAWKRFHRLHGL